MKTSAENRRVRQLLSGIQSGEITPRPEFQRNLVWSNADKLRFLDTVLSGYPFPEIYLATGEVDLETAEGTEMLVDGQQRITTLHQYFTAFPGLKLSADIKPYEAMTNEEKSAFLNYEVAVRHLGIIGPDKIREVFKRINSTAYSLNAMEVNNARYNGPLKKCAEWVAQRPFFANHDTFSAREVRRMRDVVYSLTIVISMLSTYFHRDDAIEDYLSRYNDEFPDDNEIRERVENVTAFIDDCRFPDRSRAWKKTDLLVLIVELDRLLNKEARQLDAQTVGAAVEHFYNRVDAEMAASSGDDDLQTYFKTTVQATNDRSARINRGKVLRTVILSSQESPQLV
ncbi:DUF262 domain-containing protein [Bosea sp. UC22_33]|uniref:DUF262 domain-containing protein n=1 Tax=Bosea sp. UC22_33 TaxID=3350165 RepID=UPI00366EB96C